jgi:3-hydroxyisobutyrate dehydrogenase
VRIGEAACAKGLTALDAPVSGGDIGAQNAALSIMVGGEVTAFEKARPLLEHMGKTVVLQGACGSGQHTKMVNQVVIAGSMVAICEALVYARNAGVDPARVLESIGGGAAASWALTNLYPRMLAEDYAPGFYVEHFVKDMGIALEECVRMKIELPGLTLARELYKRLVSLGHARSGTQALVLALDALNEAS